MSALKKTKEKAPNWTTYFFKAKKKIRVIYQILFYANNKSKTCYATLERIAQDCGVSINTVYEAIKIALEIGILKKENKTQIYRLHPVTRKPLFNKNIKLVYLGDTHTTAGIECFGERNSSFDFENGDKNRDKNVGYIKYKELSKERGERPPFFSLEERIEKELKEYPENLRDTFEKHLKAKYENKRHFLPIDFKEQLERFKRDNPIKACYSCKEEHFEFGSLCLKCTLESQEKTLQGVFRDIGIGDYVIPKEEIIEPTTPRLKELITRMDKIRKGKS